MTVMDVHRDGIARDRQTRRRKRIGLGFAAVPFAIAVIFAIAEATTLEPGWWGHLIQVAVVVALAALAWLRPRVGGPLFILVGGAFATTMILAGDEQWLTRLLAGAVFFAPLVVAGAVFSLVGYGRRDGDDQQGRAR